MGERHALFFGLDPKQPHWPSHQRAIESRVAGNYRVICGHCGVSLMGELGHAGGITDIVWTHDGSSWFGTFRYSEPEFPRRAYHAHGTYWSGVPTIDMPCDFCHLGITAHDPRTHACPNGGSEGGPGGE